MRKGEGREGTRLLLHPPILMQSRMGWMFWRRGEEERAERNMKSVGEEEEEEEEITARAAASSSHQAGEITWCMNVSEDEDG